MEETRTPHTLDSRTLDLVIPALAGLPDDVLNHHLQRGNQKPVQQALRKVLESTHLGRLNWSQFETLLRGISITFPPIVFPDGTLAEDEPIRQMFPKGWYMVCPAGVDLMLLHQTAGQFDAVLHSEETPWFLESYGEWKEDSTGADVERIPTEMVEIFIPDPTDWLLPGSKNTTRTRTIEMMNEFGATLPDGWTCPVPSEEELVLTAFEYHRQTGEYPLNGWNYARCSNRCRSDVWLRGGGFDSSSFDVDDWSESGDDLIGGLRWAVRRSKTSPAAQEPA